MKTETEVVLVDLDDRVVGTMEKLQAHLKGKLHRALSVFLFNSRGEMLLQRRALKKYHSGGLWTNACCSHPALGEDPLKAAQRRLKEEMGIECPLKKAFDFIYRAELDSELTEHEFDHVFVGFCDLDPILNPDEAMAFQWMAPEKLKIEMQKEPEQFTFWFQKILNERFGFWLPFAIQS